ncbi:hypothetical protein EMIHUDRAFT_205970 [Emiliania huxleyi CCMP1516]|uniref:Uncharacterized protein n=2 Tax=Emiliania huxleyi TaxID=2903 RepID=A0A0D3JQN1_EMIH1|nr:hypothetical protein EMIHUDRAFT_205970 [Emiliania huxleyi CCMP1516]EOD25816.1 hypothetical protein EMIHUDRAFT_205970 [Emiliania huxleyi CCMP1516]|eukprot:XP_005778245.1 hypothetical protein EMIHUDRAFT_205970 [Emiliania huxleyi CCMP1516]
MNKRPRRVRQPSGASFAPAPDASSNRRHGVVRSGGRLAPVHTLPLTPAADEPGLRSASTVQPLAGLEYGPTPFSCPVDTLLTPSGASFAPAPDASSNRRHGVVRSGGRLAPVHTLPLTPAADEPAFRSASTVQPLAGLEYGPTPFSCPVDTLLTAYAVAAVVYNDGAHWWADLLSRRHFTKRSRSTGSYRYDGLESGGQLRYAGRGPSPTLTSEPRHVSLVWYRAVPDE